jgi:hypothetical protein
LINNLETTFPGRGEPNRPGRHRPCEYRTRTGACVPKRDILAGSTVIAMLSTDRSDVADNGAGTALVPLMPTLQWVHKAPLPRPDPSFVTQLIANAEHLSQTSRLWEASARGRGRWRKPPYGAIFASRSPRLSPPAEEVDALGQRGGASGDDGEPLPG